MKIAFNPSNSSKNVLDLIKNNKDIIFDLKGHSIYARGVEFKGTDTNTWRDIKINNVSIGSHTLDLRNGNNTTLTNTNGVVTINSTWRPVVDNLTSNSTTSSLSANQGRVLKALIDGKSDSGHTHDDRYLKLTGGTMTGIINRRSGGSTIRGRDHAIIRQTYAPGGSSWNPIACVDTETGTWTLGHLSSGSSNTDFNFCFSTNTDYNAGNNKGNYVALRNKGGIIALTSEIPSKNSWNYDDRYYTKAESNAKYITDITTSVNKLTFTKNGSSIARTITVNNVQSLGKRSPLTERNAISGIYTYGTYSATDNLAPTNYFETLGFGEGVAGTIEIGGSWISGGKLYWRALRDCCEDWFSWKTILDSSNYSGILDSRYYTESEVNSLLSKKLDRVNLSVGTWNPRGYNLAADYHYNGGDLSISENSGKMYVSIDGQFYQNEGQYRVLDTSDIGSIRGGLTLYQHLSATDANWYPLVWGGNAHNNTSDSTGAVYKSHDKLSWQTSSQTLYATNIRTENIKHLSIGGGIYWNPNVESATDGSDVASITLVKSGVAGGTTLVLSQMNDTNDTIQFKTNTAAKLYHNSYPILTTQNTYVNNHKGYIYGAEITQVNNSDTVDGYHATDGRTFTGTINWSNNWNDAWSDGTNKHPWYGFDHRYPNTGTYSTTISDFYGMTIKTANNLRLDCANLLINGIIYINNVNAQIRREGSSQMWVNGRNGALLRETSVAGYHALWSLKTTNGSWDFGEYNAGSAWNNIPVLSYITDSNYNSGNNEPTYQIKFPLASGTVALTSDILNYYWANVKISTSSSTTTSPTVHTLTATRVCAGHDPGIDNSISCSNWFRSSGNTGWYNTTYRGGWYMSDTSWIRTYNNVGIHTGQIYADSSIRMSSIRLERTNEINSSDDLFINYGSSTNVSLCNGGGNVGIGTISPTQKLDVNGNIITKGFGIQPYYLSKSVLLPTISPGDGYKYKCLEIGRTTEISCIIADKAGLMNERGILIKFNKGYDGQIILLKDLQNYGSGNGYFWVMPSGCNIIKADGSSILVGQNQISNTYDDGHSRFLVYSSWHNVWIEFLCS